MQKITCESLIAKACELLENGTVDRVMGWKKGEFDYDLSPAVFANADEVKKNFVYNDFSGANFSKYLVKETKKSDGKVLVFLKPCDTYSFNQLLTEHRFSREKVYAVGIPCDGMADIEKVRCAVPDAISKITSDGEDIVVETIYGDVKKIAKADVMAERCVNCKSKKHTAYDELIGEDGDVIDSGRFDEVEKLENMSEDERFAFWQN
nr:4Fe-4S ferredoxin [Clostridia bacterium]